MNRVVCALRFFCGVTLGHPTIPERIVYARAPRKLPTVLSADEVVKFLESVSSHKAHVALTTAHAAGLRVSEVAALKVGDVDSGRMVMRIENGKGGKERYATLSAPLLGILRSYLVASPQAEGLRPPDARCSPGDDLALSANAYQRLAAITVLQSIQVTMRQVRTIESQRFWLSESKAAAIICYFGLYFQILFPRYFICNYMLL